MTPLRLEQIGYRSKSGHRRVWIQAVGSPRGWRVTCSKHGTVQGDSAQSDYVDTLAEAKRLARRWLR